MCRCTRNWFTPAADEHGGVELVVGVVLYNFVKEHKLGKVRVGETGVYTGRNPDTVRGLDVLFISNERYAQKKSKSFLDVAPDLAVEILSPGNTWEEMIQKMREYFSIGIKLVWIVSPTARTVFAYRSLTDVREFTDADDLPGDDVLPGFSVPVASLFED
ncbi:MAG: Uma2 family endonuclease [Chloroflexales bacterium]|nr:Uma2 family endonuclease [Chloroflexales bacterium]